MFYYELAVIVAKNIYLFYLFAYLFYLSVLVTAFAVVLLPSSNNLQILWYK